MRRSQVSPAASNIGAEGYTLRGSASVARAVWSGVFRAMPGASSARVWVTPKRA